MRALAAELGFPLFVHVRERDADKNRDTSLERIGTEPRAFLDGLTAATKESERAAATLAELLLEGDVVGEVVAAQQLLDLRQREAVDELLGRWRRAGRPTAPDGAGRPRGGLLYTSPRPRGS